jgi:thioesterase domain-containing protein
MVALSNPDPSRPDAAGLVTGADDPQAFPMSSGQRRAWLTEQFMGATAANNLCVSLRLSGALNIAALELGLRLVTGRHEILRTTFDVIAGQPVQVVHRESPRVLALIDLSHVPEPEQSAYVAARRLAYTPFDLKRGPLLRVSLLRLASEHHILLCTLHHIVADGWSLGLFIKELVDGYAALCAGRRPALKPLPLHYADYALWEQDWLESGEFRLQRAHCASRLAGAPAPHALPVAAEPGTAPSTEGASRAVRISPELMSAMKSTALRHCTTSFSLSLAAFTVLLWQLSGQHDQVLGVPAARRNRVEFEDMIGPFANIVVVRTDLSGNPAFGDLLTRTRKAILEALDDEDVPFEHLVQALQPARTIGGNPIFQILFTSVPTAAPMERFGALAAVPYVIEAVAAPFDLSVNVIQEPSGGAWVRAEYRTGVFAVGQIRRLLDHYIRLLTDVVARPETRIAKFGGMAGPWTAQRQAALQSPITTPPQGVAGRRTCDLALEQILADVWERVLQRRPSGTGVNFFDMGGHSLQAVAVAIEVSRVLGLRVPVSLLFQEPTIAGMARRLGMDGSPRCAAIPVFRGGKRPPLFVGGSAAEIRDLSRALEPEQPFFQLDILALQEQRLLAGELLLTTIPDIATEFLRDILAIEPTGPYLLAGLCDGGILALEIALRLQADGRRVALLAQFDTPVYGYFRIYWPRRLASRLLHGVTGRVLPWVQRPWSPAMQKEQHYLDHLWSVTWQAVRGYRQSALYGGEIQLFRCRSRLWLAEDITRGWEKRAARVRVHDVPGSHTRFLAEAAGQRRIAGEIERALGMADSRLMMQ